jgi:non-heme chloroperoxidase
MEPPQPCLDSGMTAVFNAREAEEIERANASGLRPVVFVHGLWLLADSWTAWREMFESRGFITLAPGWPDDPPTTDAARADVRALAGKGVRDVTDHVSTVIQHLEKRPAVVGHSFGGLIAQRLAGLGLSATTIAISPAPARGVLNLPRSSLRAAFPVLKNPANIGRTVMLTYPQFRYAFANAVSEDEAKRLYERYCVPAPGRPLFQAAAANLNPVTEAVYNYAAPDRGPLLIMSGENDNTVPWSLAHGAYKLQKRNSHNTEIRALPGRGHSLTIDNGWSDVAEVALEFLTCNP